MTSQHHRPIRRPPPVIIKRQGGIARITNKQTPDIHDHHQPSLIHAVRVQMISALHCRSPPSLYLPRILPRKQNYLKWATQPASAAGLAFTTVLCFPHRLLASCCNTSSITSSIEPAHSTACSLAGQDSNSSTTTDYDPAQAL